MKQKTKLYEKILLIFVTSIVAIGAMAQQWSGSTTTSGTITRNGIVQMLPDSSGVPYAELTPNHFKVFRYYGNQYPWENVEVAWDGIHLRRTVPAPSSSADIGHGTFYFSNYYNTGNKYIRFDSNGLLSSNGIISTTDSVLAANVKVTNSISATSESLSGSLSASNGVFSTSVTTPSLIVNGTTNPTNFLFGVEGKSYFSDFVGIGTSNLTTTSGYKLAVDGGILCEEVKVIANVPSADYVFEKSYNLRSLKEVEEYVNENKHLPEIPSAKEFREEGYKIGDFDNLLLQKIEELTLYIIDLQNQIKQLKN